MVSILLISIGITFIIYGILLFIEKIKIMKNGLKTDGSVIDFEEEANSYIDNKKKIAYKPGEKISIIYSSKDEDEFDIYVKKNIFMFLSNMISMGIIFIIFGIILSLC